MIKTIKSLLRVIMFVATIPIQTHAQGFVYDQQSAHTLVSTFNNGVDGFYIQTEPLTQSFVPTLSAIGFIQFEFEDVPNNGNSGATVYVNLWTGSPNINSATLLGSTQPVYMPNGFENNNLGLAGVTNFYFSSPIILNSGQTYYLQPVVLSGDNPWAIVTLTNTYPNGLLYGSGYAEQPGSDLWFREGVVAVPEPSALALIVLSSLLAFIFKHRFKQVILLLFSTFVLSVYAQSDSVVQATAENAGLTSATTTVLPHVGTFWVITANADGRLTEMPYPLFTPDLAGLPIYEVTNGIYIIDDTGGHISSARFSRAQSVAIAQRQANDVSDLVTRIQRAGDETFQPNDFFAPLFIDTNGLWLEALNDNSNNIALHLHNTIISDNYQLLSTMNLTSTNWNLGEITNASDIESDYSPIPATNAMTFYRVHQANPIMAIYNYQDSEELCPTNPGNTGYPGILYVENEWYAATNDLIVYYSISGTAQDGIDYSNLTGQVVMPANTSYAEIDIEPTDDGIKPNQTIILTLLQNTNYLIDPNNYSATNNLIANPQVYPIAHGDIETPCPNLTRQIQLNVNNPRGVTLYYTILSWPTHGTLDTNSIPQVYYTATNCYEGIDSFTFKVSDGQYESSPATVTLIISNGVYARPVSASTCCVTPVDLYLDGGNNCYQTMNYALLSSSPNGTLTNTTGQSTDFHYIYTPNTNFAGLDTFSYVVYDDCGSATNIVSIMVGDNNFSADAQTLLTPVNQSAAITLSATDNGYCNTDTNYFTYSVLYDPAHGTLTGTPPNLTYTPATNYQGFDSFTFTVSNGTWAASSPSTVTIITTSGPTNLTAQGRSNSIVLFWTLPDWIAQSSELSNGLYGFNIYRATSPTGPFVLTNTVDDPDEWLYEDSNVMSGATYYYKVSYIYNDGSYTYESPLSNIASTNTCNNPPYLGPIDVAFIIDDTVSIWDSSKPEITNGIAESLSYINAASGGDYRVALVTPDTDIVNVRLSLTNNFSALMNGLANTSLYGFYGPPESTDECLNTIANALTQTNRATPVNCTNAMGYPPQINDFRPVFRTNAVKFVVLITDAPPGSFCETLDLTRVHQYALDASTNHIQINAIHVYHPIQDNVSGVKPTGIVQQVMQDYANTTCGWYSHLTASPSDEDIKNAIINMLYTHGACY